MQRALAIKIVVIGLLGILMLIPLGMIQSKIVERSHYQLEAIDSIQQSWTGPQTVMAPVLVIPYSVTDKNTTTTRNGYVVEGGVDHTEKLRFVHPDKVSVGGNIVTQQLSRGIYDVPVYRTRLTMSGEFSRARVEKALAEIRQKGGDRENKDIRLAFHIADSRGISGSSLVRWNGEALGVEPGSGLPGMRGGMHTVVPPLDTGSDLSFEVGIELRGMQSLAIIPAGNEVDVSLQSQWPHPEFIGAFLPENREINDDGFVADWHVSRFASNIRDKLRSCETNDCGSLSDIAMGVRLIEPVDIYLQSERSVKYGILFVGLSFVAFFLFEQLKAVRIHPIQYGLVGFSIATFYLLLISLTEHIHFGLAYVIATVACVLINFLYLKYVLCGTKNSTYFSLTKIALFGTLYVIIQAEDFALLMGASLVFGALAIVMLITRDIDWYKTSERVCQQHKASSGDSEPGSFS